MRWLNAALQHLDRHPRLLPGALMVSLATFGVTAFGLAPLSSDAVRVPQRIVLESPETIDLAAQREALAAHASRAATWHRSTATQSGDTVPALFKRLGVLDAKALEHVRADRDWKRLLESRAGKRVQARIRGDGRLSELVARLPARESVQTSTHFTRITIKPSSDSGDAFTTQVETVPLAMGTRMGSGVVRTSLFGATDAAGLPDTVATQIVEIFASELDFQRELRRGDTFRVVYEAPMADGEVVPWNDGAGRVLAVEFVNKGEKHEAVWFEHSAGRGEYYDFQGRSRRRAFLASPLEFSRVTSGFTMRFNPVLKTWKQHLGTDYAAPTGTPVRTVGDGVVEFAGVRGGYGNTVVVKHSGNRTTLYAHLSRIDVRVNQNVDQGDRIGAVGSTGWSTGPHLHFEFKVAGEHRDPIVIAKASETVPLPIAARTAFNAQAATYLHKLDITASRLQASAAR
jgi:murein DD-endopeptidase MepM/ murein hydrolase activator NlpD